MIFVREDFIMENITVLIPVFNEVEQIESTIKALQNIDLLNRIVVIDDGSTDNTFGIANGLGVEVYKLNGNKGKGYALNYGVQKVISGSSIIIFLDGDLGSTSNEVKKLIMPILNNKADVTIAKFPPAKIKGGFGLVKGLAKFSVYKLTGKKVNTALSGQRAFRSSVLKSLYIPQDYGAEVGMLIDILNHGFRVMEVEVNMSHRETKRNLSGFLHRGKQFYQISKVVLRKYKEVKE